MPEKVAKGHSDRLLAHLAERQHGVVARHQLFELGLSRHAVDERRRRGVLHRLHRGVYAVGHPRVSSAGLYLAAVLACGDGAALSHRCAAALWCIRPSARRVVEVTVAGYGGRARRREIDVHRAGLRPEDVTVMEGIPVTTPARTLVDLADVVSRRALERAFDEAEYLRLDCTGLRPVPGRPGLGRLMEVLERHRPGTTRTRSELEDEFLELCDRFELSRPEVNAMLEGHEVDFLWREARLVVELDGRGSHGTLRAFEGDRARDAELTVAGHRVLRVTERRLKGVPAEVARQIAGLIGSCGPNQSGRTSSSASRSINRPSCQEPSAPRS